jgi:NADPH-dependent curcumin reductase CurA
MLFHLSSQEIGISRVITKRLTMKGLIVGDWLEQQAKLEWEVGGYFQAGKLKSQETVVWN